MTDRNAKAGLTYSELLNRGISRRVFTRGALSTAIAGPLLANPALMRLARAADFSGQTLKFMMINPHAGSIEPLSARLRGADRRIGRSGKSPL